ncbi:hypothetical protein, partial [Sabulibacter ruber]|uniref:hypothetical protein n=1 Tax=Sabulibacter ruber TaxID=2811901 RepID=UPI001A96BA96
LRHGSTGADPRVSQTDRPHSSHRATETKMTYATYSDFGTDKRSSGSFLKGFIAFMNAWIEKSRLFAVI